MTTATQDGAWLIVGAGYVGEAVGARALAVGAARRVFGICRRPRAAEQPWPMLTADITAPDWRRVLPVQPFATVIFCAAPHTRQSDAYAAVYHQGMASVVAALRQHQAHPPRLIVTSSTGVYDVDDGSWVDEATPTPPCSARIKALLGAEAEARRLGPDVCVLRFGGIYGPGRQRLVAQAQKAPLALRPSPHFGNHIHRDDCVGAVMHVARQKNPAPLYVAVDHEPIDTNALLCRLAAALGSDSAQSVVLPAGKPTGKRCNSARLRQSGYSFAYPTYTPAL